MLILSGVRRGRRCGVFDYSERLADKLATRATDAELLNVDDWRAAAVMRLCTALLRHRGVVHLQLPSQAMAKRLAPYLIFLAAPAARRVVTFHEFSRMTWRGKLLALPSLLLARRIIATHKGEAAAIARTYPFVKRKLCCIPIGSNIPASEAASERGTDVCFFGMIGDNPQVRQFLEVVRHTGLGSRAVLIGHAQTGDPRTAAIVAEARALGVELAFDLASEDVAFRLARVKVAVLPYEDGISERRGSALAAMANGALVVTTSPQSGGTVPFDGLCLTAANLQQLVETTRRAVADYESHAEVVARARRFAAQRSWERIAAEHIRLYGGHAPQPRYQVRTT